MWDFLSDWDLYDMSWQEHEPMPFRREWKLTAYDRRLLRSMRIEVAA